MNVKPLVNPERKYRLKSKGVIEGFWNEDNHPFEIVCPYQLQEILLYVLNNIEVEKKENKIPKLKPCPFCGKEILLYSGTDNDGFGEFFIDHQCDSGIDISMSDNNEYSLRETWNKRIGG